MAGYTFYDATLNLARTLGDVTDSTATSGSTATLIDSKVVSPAGHYVGGTIWLDAITSPTRADQFRRVSSFAASTFTVDSNWTTSNPTAGEVYHATDDTFPLAILKQGINVALQDIGRLPLEATTTAANKTTYTSSDSPYFDNEILMVEVSSNTSEPYNWSGHYMWHQTAGASRSLIFDSQAYVADSTSKIRLTYLDFHPELSLASDVISSYIDPVYVKWAAAVHCWRWRLQILKSQDQTSVEMMNEAQTRMTAELEKAKADEAVALALESAKEAKGEQLSALNKYLIQARRTSRMARWGG